MGTQCMLVAVAGVDAVCIVIPVQYQVIILLGCWLRPVIIGVFVGPLSLCLAGRRGVIGPKAITPLIAGVRPAI